MKKYKILLLIILLVFICAPNSWAAEPLKIPILMYHHIDTLWNWDISDLREFFNYRKNFSAHLKYLKKEGFNTVTFLDIQEHLSSGKPLPAKPIIITFDDGGRDNWDAFLELKEQGFAAVFFVVTELLDDRTHLSTEQLRIMSAAGMEIGSHALHHYNLTRINLSAAEKEIKDSKVWLSALLQRPVITFCYPYGGYNQDTISLVKEAGYSFARTTQQGLAEISTSNYALRSIRIHNFFSADLLARTLEGYGTYIALRQ